MMIMHEIQKATLAARARTGDASIAVRLHRGRSQVARVTYSPNGAARIVPLSPYGTHAETIKRLELI